MSIVHKSRSGQTTQDLFAPAEAKPLMERSSVPPPFQLIESSGSLQEDAEGVELASPTTDVAQTLADGEAPPPSGGGDGGGGAEEGAGASEGTGTPTASLAGDSGGEALPENLKANLETISGYNLSGVKVKYNSKKPEILGAGGLAKGNQIDLAPGKEQHLSTAAYALIQQRQGKVGSTKTIQGVEVNDDSSLESEAKTKSARYGRSNSRIRRFRKQRFNVLTEDSTVPSIVVVPGSFKVIEDDDEQDVEIAETMTEEVETEPFTPTIPENTVVDVPEIDLTLGYDNLKDITKGSVADTLGVSLDFLRSVVFDLTLKFSFYLGIEVEVLKGLFGVEGGFLFEAAASLNQQDDRLVRAGWTISYGGQLVTTILWFIKNKNTWLHSFGRLSVYQDMAHFSAHQFNKLSEMVDDVADETGEVERLPQDSHDGEGRDMDALRAVEPTDVHTSGYSREHEVGVGAEVPGGADYGASFSSTTSSKEMNFYRGEGEDRQVRQATQEDQSYSGTINIGRTEATLAFTDTVIENHANEDNDGHYHNWSLTLKNPPSRSPAFANKFGEVMQNIADRISVITTTIRAGQVFGAGAWGTVKALILAEDFSDLDNDDGGSSVSGSGKIDHYYTAEFNYVDSQGEMALQYLRLSKGTSASIGFEAEIPVFSNGVVGVNVHTSASASIDFSATLLEVTSAETITYFMTVYNGLVYTDAQVASGFAPSKDGGWVAYRTQHQPGIRRLIVNLANPESVPYKEVAGYESAHPSSVPLLLQAAQDYVAGTIDLDTAIASLENFLSENYVKKGERSSQVGWNEDDFETDGRTPWAKVASGNAEYTTNIDRSGNMSLTQDAFNPGSGNVAQRPQSIVESLLQNQDVKCRLKIPYYEKVQTGVSGPRGNRKRTYEYHHSSTQEVNIGKLTNRLEAAEHLKGAFRNVWGDSPFRIHSDIRAKYFNTPELTGHISEIRRLEGLGRTGHPRRRNGYKAQARSKEREYLGKADEQLREFMDVVLTKEL